MFEGNHCYEMYLIQYQRTVKFKVNVLTSDGVVTATECGTGAKIIFGEYQLLKKEYSTLIEFDCADCQ